MLINILYKKKKIQKQKEQRLKLYKTRIFFLLIYILCIGSETLNFAPNLEFAYHRMKKKMVGRRKTSILIFTPSYLYVFKSPFYQGHSNSWLCDEDLTLNHKASNLNDIEKGQHLKTWNGLLHVLYQFHKYMYIVQVYIISVNVHIITYVYYACFLTMNPMCSSHWNKILSRSVLFMMVTNFPLTFSALYKKCLDLSQTSHGFYVFPIQVFKKHWGKRRNCS